MTASKTAALVIDVQLGLVQGAHRESEVLAAIKTTISKVRGCGGQVVFVQHCHATWEPLKKGNPGWVIHPAIETQSSDLFVEKTASDSFYESELADVLVAHEIDRLVVMGLQTEFCVDATCRAALSRGFEVILVADGHTTGDAKISAEDAIAHHNYALANLAHPSLQIQVAASASIKL